METRYDEQVKAMICIPDKDITIETSPQINTECEKIVERGVKNIVMNLSRVTYIDSSGLATLVAILKKLKNQQGQLKVSNISQKVRGLFEITKLDKLFALYATEEEARQSLQ